MVAGQIAAAVLLAQAASAPAPTTAPVARPGAAAAPTTVSPIVVSPKVTISKRRDVDPDEVTCHKELPPGTRFAIQVCATNRQFAERSRDQQELLREWQNTPVTTGAR